MTYRIVQNDLLWQYLLMSLFLISSAVLAVATVCLGFVLVRRAQLSAPEGFEDATGFHASLPPARAPLPASNSWAA